MSHQNPSGRAPNRRPPNGATAWPGRFNETIFGPRFPHPGCQTLRLNQLKTGKQHGLTGSTDPFLTCISPHPAAKRRTWIPQRKQVFWLALPCIPCSIEVLAWFCYDFTQKPPNSDPKRQISTFASQKTKKTSRSRETAWPGRFNGSIFDIHVTPPRCQTIAVKFWFCFCDNVTPKPPRCV